MFILAVIGGIAIAGLALVGLVVIVTATIMVLGG